MREGSDPPVDDEQIADFVAPTGGVDDAAVAEESGAHFEKSRPADLAARLRDDKRARLSSSKISAVRADAVWISRAWSESEPLPDSFFDRCHLVCGESPESPEGVLGGDRGHALNGKGTLA